MLVALTTSCVPRTELEVPPLDGAESVLFVVFSAEGDTRAVFAYGAQGDFGKSLVLRDTDEVVALLYGCGLDALELGPEGESLCAREEGGKCVTEGGGRPLPESPFEVKRVMVGAGDGWESVQGSARDALDARLRDLRISGSVPDDCAWEVLYSEPLPGSEGAPPSPFAVDLGDGRVLVAPNGGPFHYASAAGLALAHDVPANAPSLAGYRDPDGRMWMFGEGGMFARWTAAGGLESLPLGPNTNLATAAVLAGSLGDGPLELAAFTNASDLASFDSTNTWNEALYIPGEGRARVFLVATQVGFLALLPGVETLRRLAGGQVTRSPLHLPADDVPTSMAFHPEVGLLLGTRDGSVVRKTDLGSIESGQWDVLQSGQTSAVHALGYANGAILIGTFAGMVSLGENSPECSFEVTGGVERILPAGDQVIVVSAAQDLWVTVFGPAGSGPKCGN